MFQFRRFDVHDDRCAMKVGTDGVLLGAWAEGGRRILDVGTGTGLIALMMAQRFAEADVTAIDIDAEACRQAAENVATSPFAQRIETLNISLQEYVKSASPVTGGALRFDAIVSNPPFFENSLRSPDSGRSIARHAIELPYSTLFQGVANLLTHDGVFSAIIPMGQGSAFLAEASLNGFFVMRRCDVRTIPMKPPRRMLLSFSRRMPENFFREETCLQDGDGARSAWYKALTDAFYIK